MQGRLSVDPGLSGTGWAFWRESEWSKCVPPEATGVEHAGGDEWHVRTFRIVNAVCSRVSAFEVSHVYIEWAQFYDDPGGHMAAARGDLNKLVFITAALASALHFDIGAKFVPVPVREWKGQLPKRVCNHRIKELLGEQACSNFKTHAWDAVGVGLFKKGFFE